LLGARVYFLAQENIKPFHCRDRVIATAADASLLVESRASPPVSPLYGESSGLDTRNHWTKNNWSRSIWI